MTQTHTTEVQKTLPTTAVLLNKRVTFSESGTSQNKCIFADKARGECSRAPPGFACPPGPICSAALQEDELQPQTGRRMPTLLSLTGTFDLPSWKLSMYAFNKHFNSAMCQALF